MSKFEWTAAAVEKVRARYGSASTTALAREIGCTKNALIGMADRLRRGHLPRCLAPQPPPRKRKPPAPRSRGRNLPPEYGALVCPYGELPGGVIGYDHTPAMTAAQIKKHAAQFVEWRGMRHG